MMPVELLAQCPICKNVHVIHFEYNGEPPKRRGGQNDHICILQRSSELQYGKQIGSILLLQNAKGFLTFDLLLYNNPV